MSFGFCSVDAQKEIKKIFNRLIWNWKKKRERATCEYVTYATTQVDPSSLEPPPFITGLMKRKKKRL